jgi:hypothetical protein
VSCFVFADEGTAFVFAYPFGFTAEMDDEVVFEVSFFIEFRCSHGALAVVW